MGASDKDCVLAAAIESVEGLRIQNPVNGDGSNWMLDRVIARLASLGDEPLDDVVRGARRDTTRSWEHAALQGYAAELRAIVDGIE